MYYYTLMPHMLVATDLIPDVSELQGESLDEVSTETNKTLLVPKQNNIYCYF